MRISQNAGGAITDAVVVSSLTRKLVAKLARLITNVAFAINVAIYRYLPNLAVN